MSDPLDDAAEATEVWLAEKLRTRAKVPEKTGICLVPGCGEPTEGAFCSADCREDYEKITRLNAIKGK
jgi:hypothetical protein